MKFLLRIVQIVLLILTVLNGGFSTAAAQNSQTPKTDKMRKLYLDCSNCFEDYIRSEISFIHFVRDPSDAHIHLLITQTPTASGGREYFLKFLGRKKLDGDTDTLTYVSASSDTETEERAGLLRYIKVGLLPFLTNTPLIKYADLNIKIPEEESSRQQHDKWKNWIFDTDLIGDFDRAERQTSYELEWDFDATRLTPRWKIDLELDYDFALDHFVFDDAEDITSITTRNSFEGLAVKSIDSHLSAGVIARVASSTFSNIDLEVFASPVLEYNIFPYHEYHQRELRFQYRITPLLQHYRDTTIFNKSEDQLVQEELEVLLKLNEAWGSIETSLQGSHFFFDFSKNRLEFENSINFRIFRGFSVEFQLNYSIINDQITLPKEDLTDEEIILKQRELATSYSLSGTIGISYTFGSIYNNIVNPRIR